MDWALLGEELQRGTYGCLAKSDAVRRKAGGAAARHARAIAELGAELEVKLGNGELGGCRNWCKWEMVCVSRSCRAIRFDGLSRDAPSARVLPRSALAPGNVCWSGVWSGGWAF